MTEETRPVDRRDWWRLSLVLDALVAKAVHQDEREMWAILRDLHIDQQPPPGVEPVDPDALIGDAALNREVQFAEIVVEAMVIRAGVVPSRPTSGTYRVCAVPGCGELTHTRLCPTHELEQG